MDFGGEIGIWQRRLAECNEGLERRNATLKAMAIEPGKTYLDVGCGGGHLVRDIGRVLGKATLQILAYQDLISRILACQTCQFIHDELYIFGTGAQVHETGAHTEAPFDRSGSQERKPTFHQLSEHDPVAFVVEMAQAKTHAVENHRCE